MLSYGSGTQAVICGKAIVYTCFHVEKVLIFHHEIVYPFLHGKTGWVAKRFSQSEEVAG